MEETCSPESALASFEACSHPQKQSGSTQHSLEMESWTMDWGNCFPTFHGTWPLPWNRLTLASFYRPPYRLGGLLGRSRPACHCEQPPQPHPFFPEEGAFHTASGLVRTGNPNAQTLEPTPTFANPGLTEPSRHSSG